MAGSTSRTDLMVILSSRRMYAAPARGVSKPIRSASRTGSTEFLPGGRMFVGHFGLGHAAKRIAPQGLATSRLAVWLVLSWGLLGVTRTGQAQIPLHVTPSAPASSAESAADPYGRETPYGCFLGFIRAMRDGHDEIAAHYLQLAKTGLGEAPEEIARE